MRPCPMIPSGRMAAVRARPRRRLRPVSLALLQLRVPGQRVGAISLALRWTPAPGRTRLRPPPKARASAGPIHAPSALPRHSGPISASARQPHAARRPPCPLTAMRRRRRTEPFAAAVRVATDWQFGGGSPGSGQAGALPTRSGGGLPVPGKPGAPAGRFAPRLRGALRPRRGSPPAGRMRPPRRDAVADRSGRPASGGPHPRRNAGRCRQPRHP